MPDNKRPVPMTATWYGQPIKELTREELERALCELGALYLSTLGTHIREWKFLFQSTRLNRRRRHNDGRD